MKPKRLGFSWDDPQISATPLSRGLTAADMERDKGRRAPTGETAGSPPPRSSLTAFQAYHRSVLLILEDAKLQLPDAYPELVKILAKKLEREM